MKEKSRKSANGWNLASERALVAIWDDEMTRLRGCRKNSHILVDMVAELKNRGFFYTAIELKTKMHNMSARYRKEKQQIRTTGGSTSEWDLFKDMQALLSPAKSDHREHVVHDNINVPSSLSSPSTRSLTLPSAPPGSSTSMPAASLGSSMSRDSLCNLLKEIQEEMRKTSQSLIKIEEEKKNILKEYVDREAEVQKALIEFLKGP